MKKQQGFTIIELAIVICFLGGMILGGWFVYNAYIIAEHFITKWW